MERAQKMRLLVGSNRHAGSLYDPQEKVRVALIKSSSKMPDHKAFNQQHTLVQHNGQHSAKHS